MSGILPVVSHRNAVFMNQEISGIRVADDIVRMYEGLDRDQAARQGVDLSLDFMREASDYCDGFYLITPFNRVEIIEEIIERYRAESHR